MTDQIEAAKADKLLKEMEEMTKDMKLTKDRCVNFSMDLTLTESYLVCQLIARLRK